MVAGFTKKDSNIPGLKDGICLLPMDIFVWLYAVSHRHKPTIGKGKLEDNYRGIPHWHRASIGLIFMLFTFSRGVSSGGPQPYFPIFFIFYLS